MEDFIKIKQFFKIFYDKSAHLVQQERNLDMYAVKLRSRTKLG